MIGKPRGCSVEKSETPTAWVMNPSKLSGSLSKFGIYAKYGRESDCESADINPLLHLNLYYWPRILSYNAKEGS